MDKTIKRQGGQSFMKNSRSFFAVALVATIAFSSCNNGSEDHDNAPPLITRSSVTQTTPEETYYIPDKYLELDGEPVTQVAPDAVMSEDPETIRSGTWFCYDPSESSYLFFDHTEKMGAEIRVNSGVAETIMYELSEDNKSVNFYSRRFDSYVVVNYIDPTHAELVLPAKDGGEKIKKPMLYVSEDRFNSFILYTDQEFEKMAIDYYNDHTTKKKNNLLAQCVTGEDSMVLINLYIITGAGDMKIYETYTVNRLDAMGTDSQGNVIDLK